MKGFRCLPLVALLLLVSCSRQDMHELAPGLFVKKIRTGNTPPLEINNAILELRLNLQDAGGKKLACSPEFAFENGFDSLVPSGSEEDLLNLLLKNIGIGDSIFFELEKSAHLKRKFGRINGPYKGFMRVTRQWYPANDEKTILAIEEQSIARKVAAEQGWQALANGLFIKWNSGGLRDSGSLSENVCLRYKGGFLNGRIIDNHSKTCFEFIAAGEKQLIPGLEWFARRAIPGSSATLIIPHSMAYGPPGSSTGIVPPYKTLIFDAFILPAPHDHSIPNSESNP